MEKHESLVIFDGDPAFKRDFVEWMKKLGHTVQAEAGDIVEADEIILDEDIHFRMAVVGDRFRNKGDDKLITGLLEEKRPEVIVISLSHQPRQLGHYQYLKSGPRGVLLSLIELL